MTKRRPRPEPWHAGPRQSRIRFSLRHLIVAKMSGKVVRWRASFIIDPDDPGRSSIDVVIDAASLQTGVTERDRHVRSAEFLDVARFPEIQYRSREVRLQRGNRRFTIIGDLTIRNVTREVPVTIARKGAASQLAQAAKLSFTGRATISRRDFGLRWPHERERGAGLMAGDKVDIQLEINARRGVK
jgi:polyisoprenoid-binding protein YceI